jgi:hypothetical protein
LFYLGITTIEFVSKGKAGSLYNLSIRSWRSLMFID